ncbi:MAG: peptidylprolyl isomerase [Alphaproteobacteria bacterium]|nr:peptidylprolyl isomerase [Alphaproteobacteria bacterium]
MIIATLFRTFGVLLLATLIVACGPEPRRTLEAVDPDPQVLDPETADPVIARVNGSVIRRSDILREFEAQQSERESSGEIALTDFERIREELIDQRLLAIEARARGLHQSEEARRQMAHAQERILSNVLVDEVLTDATTEDAIRRIYDEQVQLIALGDEVRARHILVDTQEEADAAMALLVDGTDFAALAIRISLDSATRLEGGDLGYFTRSGIADPFGAIAFGLEEGEMSPPFQTAFGWHILKVEDRRRQPPPSFEVLRPRIEEFYKFDRLVDLVAELRDGASITLIDMPLAELAADEPEDDVPPQ